MNTYIRINISPMSISYPYNAPELIKNQARSLCNKYNEYCIHNESMLMLVPVESRAYNEILDFIYTNVKYFANINILYERKYTKQEIIDAEYYVLRVANIVYTKNGLELFDFCCENRHFSYNQLDNIQVESKSMMNKHLGFTTVYRFLVSPELYTKIRELSFSNINFRPAYTRRKMKIPIAYQIEAAITLPALADINKWTPYLKCDKRDLIVYASNYSNQLSIPKDLKAAMFDFNATFETFTDLASHEYIISKRFYDLLNEFNVDKLVCEPVKFV